jgi:glycosyltransferase involved in cell wall biosynthesis
MRLSDFFLVCPNALFLRDGQICEECRSSMFGAVKHKCVKNSLVGSFLKICAMYFHRLIRIYGKVNYIVSPSSFTLSKINKRNTIHLPTFVFPPSHPKFKIGRYVLFVGRIEKEKGINIIIEAMKGLSQELKIVGKSSTGYEKIIKESRNIKYLGPKYGKELDDLYQNARVIVMPAVWYENMPNVALEAMSFGKPVIASSLGSLKEIIKDNHNGLLFKPGDSKDLQEKLIRIFKDDKLCKELGKNGYEDALNLYSPNKHYKKLMKIFNKAIAEEKAKWKR